MYRNTYLKMCPKREEYREQVWSLSIDVAINRDANQSYKTETAALSIEWKETRVIKRSRFVMPYRVEIVERVLTVLSKSYHQIQST